MAVVTTEKVVEQLKRLAESLEAVTAERDALREKVEGLEAIFKGEKKPRRTRRTPVQTEIAPDGTVPAAKPRVRKALAATAFGSNGAVES